MEQHNESTLSPRWAGFKRIWLIIAILLFLLLLLLWLLGYGPGGRNCEITPKTVEKLVDNPVHMQRIATLEKETALIAGLRTRISELENAEPKVVETTVEKVVEKKIDNPENLKRILELESENALLAGLRAKIIELEGAEPKVVEKLVDNPEHLSRISLLETENTQIVELRARITELEGAEPKVVEKLVEKLVDNPEHLSRISLLETENAQIVELRARITELEGAEPKVVEKLVEKLVDNPEHLSRISALESENTQIEGLHTNIKSLQHALSDANKKGTTNAFQTRLFFRISSYDVPANSRLYLSPLVNHLKSNPDLKVSVSGFHDLTGFLAANRLLASQRAEMVKKLLVKSGISESQISVTQPAESVGTGLPAEARRVEIKIIN